MGCELCPRKCEADRVLRKGYCGAGNEIMIARAALHFWEEPCISGKHDGNVETSKPSEERGSGTIFFSGCPLRCIFCQNHEISFLGKGKSVTREQLGEIMLKLRDDGAYNINLVSPTQYAEDIAATLELIKPKLGIPVVWNTGGYEILQTLKLLDGLVDIWLPDIKYKSTILSTRYAAAENYFEYASQAAEYMVKSAGKPQFFADGMLKSGVIIRHMVLPGSRADSIDIMRWINEKLGANNVLVSIMSQYTPTESLDTEKYPELKRKITTFEYQSVIDEADKFGFTGYTQRKTSATKLFVPDFDFTGVK